MDYNKIVAVTGLSGLYEMVSSKQDGGVVRSLEDKTSKFVSNRQHSFSHLESIEVYTNADNVNLIEVFNAMDNSKETLPDANDNAALKAYFQKVYPDMDFTRVYNSDMKKMVKWHSVLKNAGVEIKYSQKEEEAQEGDEVAAEEKPKAEKKTATEKTEKKTTTAKKSATNTAKPAKANAPAKKVNAPRKMA